MNPPSDGWSLTIPPRLWHELSRHLFQDHRGEHGAVILAGRAEGPRGPRLLARELHLAKDGVDYVPGTVGHHALSPMFIGDNIDRARAGHLAYIAVHNHFDPLKAGTVAFSAVDMASHERGYPTLRQISGDVVGGLVLTPYAAAGDLWLPDGTRATLTEVVIPGNNLIRLRPRPAQVGPADEMHNRQTRVFGDRGQAAFNRMQVAIVGLGGVGSILVELLARVGVGHLTLIDPDVIEDTNLPRLVGSQHDDVDCPKIGLAERNARRANPKIGITAIPKLVQSTEARCALTHCDWIFLAADGHAARHFVNAVVHCYLIPATQAGVKIPVLTDGHVGEVHTATRLFLPGQGCAWCDDLIDPTELAIEMHPEQERRAARYVDDVPAPSVITLNAVAAAEAANHFMLAVANLHTDDADHAHVLHQPRRRERMLQNTRLSLNCPWCASTGALGRGDTEDWSSFADHQARTSDN